MVGEFVNQDGIIKITFKNVVITLLLYTNDMVRFANTLGDAKKHMKTLEEFCIKQRLYL